jgi:hypothetical protein
MAPSSGQARSFALSRTMPSPALGLMAGFVPRLPRLRQTCSRSTAELFRPNASPR